MEILKQAKDFIDVFNVSGGYPGADIIMNIMKFLQFTLVASASAIIFMVAMEIRKFRAKKQQ